MEPITPYRPLTRAPLRMRGIFGIAWQLYKRGFFPMLVVSLLLISLPTLLMTLPQFRAVSQTGLFTNLQERISQFGKLSSISKNADVAGIGAVLGSSLLASLLSVVVRFLIRPMYQGAVFLEMEERMEGRAGTLNQLFRYALPLGLKRFYTTFLSQFALEIGIGFIAAVLYISLGIVGVLIGALNFIRMDFSYLSLLSTVGIYVLLIVLISLLLYVFLMLI